MSKCHKTIIFALLFNFQVTEKIMQKSHFSNSEEKLGILISLFVLFLVRFISKKCMAMIHYLCIMQYFVNSQFLKCLLRVSVVSL